jgi:hypothetical protein
VDDGQRELTGADLGCDADAALGCDGLILIGGQLLDELFEQVDVTTSD